MHIHDILVLKKYMCLRTVLLPKVNPVLREVTLTKAIMTKQQREHEMAIHKFGIGIYS